MLYVKTPAWWTAWLGTEVGVSIAAHSCVSRYAEGAVSRHILLMVEVTYERWINIEWGKLFNDGIEGEAHMQEGHEHLLLAFFISSGMTGE